MAIPSPTCTAHQDGANSCGRRAIDRPRGPSDRDTRLLPDPVFTAGREPDFIVSGWGWVSTNSRNSPVLHLLQSSNSDQLAAVGRQNPPGPANFDQRISRSTGRDTAGCGPSLQACRVTGPRPKSRRQHVDLARGTLDSTDLAAILPDRDRGRTCLSSRDLQLVGRRRTGRRRDAELDLLRVVVDDHRQDEPSAGLDLIRQDGDDTQFVVSVGELRGVELRRSARTEAGHDPTVDEQFERAHAPAAAPRPSL